MVPSQSIRRAIFTGIILSGVTATLGARQSSLDSQYLSLVEEYASGAHESKVAELLSWPAQDASAVALRSLRDRTKLHEVVTRKEGPDGGPALRRTTDYLRSLRAMAAIHLEAAVAVPVDMETARREHFRASEAAIRLLDRTRDVLWKSVVGTDDAVVGNISRFRRDWYVVAATHFQRIGAFVDATRVVDLAVGEFRDQTVFHVIEGSIHDALASPIASLDAARQRLYPARYPERFTEVALQKARQAYERALNLDSRNEEARIRLSRVHVMLGQFDAASAQLRDEAAPGRFAYLLSLVRGSLAEARSHYDAAVLHYREAAAVSSQWQTACVALAHAQVKQGRLPDARDTLRSCASQNVTDDDPWLTYAMGLSWLVEPTLRELRREIDNAQVEQDD